MSPESTSSPEPPESVLSSSLPVILSLPDPVFAFSNAFTADSVMLRVPLTACASIRARLSSMSVVLAERSSVSMPPAVSSRKKLPVWLALNR